MRVRKKENEKKRFLFRFLEQNDELATTNRIVTDNNNQEK
jgi:hypothetical protein